MTIRPLALTLGLVMLVAAAPPRFYPDDPLAREPESCDASGDAPINVGLMYDIAFNMFATARREPSNVHA